MGTKVSFNIKPEYEYQSATLAYIFRQRQGQNKAQTAISQPAEYSELQYVQTQKAKHNKDAVSNGKNPFPLGTEHKYQGHTIIYIPRGKEQLTENLMAIFGGTPSNFSEAISGGAHQGS